MFVDSRSWLPIWSTITNILPLLRYHTKNLPHVDVRFPSKKEINIRKRSHKTNIIHSHPLQSIIKRVSSLADEQWINIYQRYFVSPQWCVHLALSARRLIVIWALKLWTNRAVLCDGGCIKHHIAIYIGAFANRSILAPKTPKQVKLRI